ncbi:class I SAM-dependent methyltransferase [Salinimicrobium catena]|uniref:class I SAM-dependent methyltransferase n=1 Tax=Salinimicrobium catena TaxID=390640 RepID=UPI002FE43689
MDKYKETFNTWNKVAKLYQDSFFDFNLYNDTYDAFCALLPDVGSKILDLGCGPGNITNYLFHKRPDFKITGIDVAPQMLELAKKNNPTADFELMDIRDLHKLNKSFNGIIAGFCFPYLSGKDLTRLFEVCKNLLEPPGIFYLSFVEGDPNDSEFQTGSEGDRVFFYYHDLNTTQHDLESFGFEVLDIIHKTYQRPGKREEIHTVVLAKNAAL